MEATETTIRERAAAAARWFESARRDPDIESTRFVRLKADRPEWVQNLVREAHAGMLPDDYRYEAIRDALEFIGEGNENAFEFADNSVDVYTAALTDWLGSHGSRSGYCDDAEQEFGPTDEGIVKRLQVGQYMELVEVFGLVVEALENSDA